MGFNTYPPNPFPPNSNSVGGGGGSYELPIATSEILGGVKVGNGLTINGETGVLSADKQIRNYSTTEHATGEKWIDGKDIYRKVFVFENIPASTPASMAHGITNLGDVVVLIGTGVLSDRIIALPYVDDIATYQRGINLKDGSITITGYANSAAVGKANIIMKYTKTESEG